MEDIIEIEMELRYEDSFAHTNTDSAQTPVFGVEACSYH
jgi:hypothetical protein